jgi:hypothetical protein
VPVRERTEAVDTRSRLRGCNKTGDWQKPLQVAPFRATVATDRPLDKLEMGSRLRLLHQPRPLCRVRVLLERDRLAVAEAIHVTILGIEG